MGCKLQPQLFEAAVMQVINQPDDIDYLSALPCLAYDSIAANIMYLGFYIQFGQTLISELTDGSRYLCAQRAGAFSACLTAVH